MKNNIPQGYKATALGIIPQEWEIFDFDEIVEKSKERYIPNPDTHLYCIELEHLSQGEGTLIDIPTLPSKKAQKTDFKMEMFYLASYDHISRSIGWLHLMGFARLKSGYFMQSPIFASKSIYFELYLHIILSRKQMFLLGQKCPVQNGIMFLKYPF